MRISLVNFLYPPLGIGGSEQSVRYLALGLQRLGHEVRVFTQNVDNEPVDEVIDGVPVTRIASPPGREPNVLNEGLAQRTMKHYLSGRQRNVGERLRPYLEAFGPEILHTNVFGGLPQIWRVGQELGATVVHTIRSYSLICRDRMLIGDQACTRQCRDCALRIKQDIRDDSSSIDGVVGISRHVLEVHRTAGWFVDVPEAAVIANSYELSDDIAEDAEDVPREYDFGFIGRLHPTKGVEVFLDAVRRANAARTDHKVRALVAGSGNPGYVETLRREYESPEIEFIGYVATDRFFRAVKYCVVPSLWFEPFGRVFIESLFHGVPVLGSLRGGGSEVLTDATGWLFDPGDSASLDRAIESAAGLDPDAYARMRDACIEDSRQYTVSAIAEQYDDFYRRAEGGRRGTD